MQPHLTPTLPTPEEAKLRPSSQPYDYGILHVGSGTYDPGRMSPFLPSGSPGLGVKLELLDSPQQGQQAPGLPHPGAMFSRDHSDHLLPVLPTTAAAGQQGGGGQGSRGSDARSGASNPPRRDGRPHISHSTVEKQRRDRINSLIDELRDLVPPQAGCGPGEAGEGSDSRRPKHVVLSDTIQLVRELQEKVSAAAG